MTQSYQGLRREVERLQAENEKLRDELEFMQSVFKSKERMAEWPEWKKNAADRTRVSDKDDD